jgi:hypothetical protein
MSTAIERANRSSQNMSTASRMTMRLPFSSAIAAGVAGWP